MRHLKDGAAVCEFLNSQARRPDGLMMSYRQSQLMRQTSPAAPLRAKRKPGCIELDGGRLRRMPEDVYKTGNAAVDSRLA